MISKCYCCGEEFEKFRKQVLCIRCQAEVRQEYHKLAAECWHKAKEVIRRRRKDK